MPQDRFFSAPFGRNIQPGVLYGTNFATVYSNNFFAAADAPVQGFGIDLTGNDVFVATFGQGVLSLDVGLVGYTDTTTSTSGLITNSFADWSTYWELTPVNPTGTLTGFPAFLNLSLLDGLGSIARADGGDIRVSDTGNRELACDLMPWYVSGSGGLYINFETKTTGTQPIRVWAGNPTATLPAKNSTYGQYATYHTGIRSFYPSGGGQDRTSYQNHLTAAGGISYTTGFVKGSMAGQYDGVIESIATGTIPTGTPYYLSASHNIRSSSDQAVIMLYRNSTANQWYELNFNPPDIRAGMFNAGGVGYLQASVSTARTGVWQNSAVIFRDLASKTAFLSGVAGVSSFNSGDPGPMDRLAIGYRQGFGRASGLIYNCAFITQIVPDAWAAYQHANMADTNQTGFWTSIVRVPAVGGGGESVLLTGLSNSLTQSFGDFYQNYYLIGSSLSNTSSNASVNNTLGFQGISNTTTIDIGTIVNSVSFAGLSNVYTNATSNLINTLGLAGNILSYTDDSGSLRLNLGFSGVSNTQTSESAAINNNLSMLGISEVSTYSSGDFRILLGFNGISNTVTNESGNIRIGLGLGGTSNTYTFDSGSLTTALGLVGFSNTQTNEFGTINNNLGFDGISNTQTSDSGNLYLGLGIAGTSNTQTNDFLNLGLGLGFSGISNTQTADSLNLGLSLGLVGTSESRTIDFGNLALGLGLFGTSQVTTSDFGTLRANLDFAGISNTQTTEAGNLTNSLGLAGSSDTSTSDSGNLRNNVSFAGNSLSNTASYAAIANGITFAGLIGSTTSSEGNASANLSFGGFSNTYTQDAGTINNNVAFVGQSNNQTASSGEIRNNLGFAGSVGAITSASLETRIAYALNALSSSVTDIQGAVDLQGSVTLAGIISANTSSNAVLNLLLVLNATAQAATILQQAGVDVNRMLVATSNTSTRALADVYKTLALGGNINSITTATANAQINILLNGLIGAVTQLDGNLGTQGQVALQGVINVLSQVSGYINVNLSFGGVIHGKTSSSGDLVQSVSQALAGIISSRTGASGVVVSGITLDSTSSTDTDISGTINLNIGLGSIVQVLTSLNGQLEGSAIAETGETFRFTVYKITSYNFSVGVQQSFNESVLLVGR